MIKFLRRKLRHGQIFALVGVFHLRAETIIGVIEVFVVFRRVFIENMIFDLLDLDAVRALGDELVIRHGGEKNLPVRLSEADKDGVYLHSVFDKSARAVDMPFVHEGRKWIFFHKVDGDRAILVDIAQAAVCFGQHIRINALIARISEDIYLQSAEKIVRFTAVFLYGFFDPAHEFSAKIDVFLVAVFIYHNDVFGLALENIAENDRYICLCLAGDICHFLHEQRLAFFRGELIHDELGALVVARIDMRAALVPAENIEFFLFAEPDSRRLRRAPQALSGKRGDKQDGIDADNGETIIYGGKIKGVFRQKLRNRRRAVFEHDQIHALIDRGKEGFGKIRADIEMSDEIKRYRYHINYGASALFEVAQKSERPPPVFEHKIIKNVYKFAGEQGKTNARHRIYRGITHISPVKTQRAKTLYFLLLYHFAAKRASLKIEENAAYEYERHAHGRDIPYHDAKISSRRFSEQPRLVHQKPRVAEISRHDTRPDRHDRHQNAV